MRIAKLAVLLGSLAFSAIVVEMGLRALMDPMDYLKPELVLDPILGQRIVPGSGGHDEWGYRNASVPEQVDVVAIGDSQTYGQAAVSRESWPNWYSQMSGREVYTLGIGGFGPADYLYLLETKALLFQPELIIVGLYYGNDIHDAYRAVSKRSHWASLREAPVAAKTRAVMPDPSPTTVAKSGPGNQIKILRDWLRAQSMLFRIIEEGPVGQRINAWGDQQDGFSRDGCIVTTTQPFSTVFQPEHRFRGMDPADREVATGLDLTLTFVSQMAELAERNDVDFLVALIPTKESVLVTPSDHPGTHCESVLQEIIVSEEVIGRRVRSFLDERDIAYVDTLEPLRTAAREERIYLRSADSHPNGQGYRVIAEE
ncbi:MAG: SGNH/GDSL hydrolase family protein, partial [Deltaproteobacteria bacterium]|nr:SGNH/GDSL hydrolase family protein [Deltaproteobacteria bacterium]